MKAFSDGQMQAAVTAEAGSYKLYINLSTGTLREVPAQAICTLRLRSRGAFVMRAVSAPEDPLALWASGGLGLIIALHILLTIF